MLNDIILSLSGSCRSNNNNNIIIFSIRRNENLNTIGDRGRLWLLSETMIIICVDIPPTYDIGRYYYSAISLEIGVSMHKLSTVRFLASGIQRLKWKKRMLMIRTRMRYVKILNSWRANKIGRSSSSLPCAIFRTNHRRRRICARCETYYLLLL